MLTTFKGEEERIGTKGGGEGKKGGTETGEDPINGGDWIACCTKEKENSLPAHPQGTMIKSTYDDHQA